MEGTLSEPMRAFKGRKVHIQSKFHGYPGMPFCDKFRKAEGERTGCSLSSSEKAISKSSPPGCRSSACAG